MMPNPNSDKKKTILRFFITALTLASLTLIFVVVSRMSGENALDQVEYERREAAKDFYLPVIGRSEHLDIGTTLSLSQLRKKPVLLHFWASWCTVCRDEKPDIDAFWAKHKDEDIAVVSIASFDTKEAMAESKLIEKPTFTVLLDEDGEVANKYKVSALPISVLIDEEGFVVRTFKGVLKPYDFVAIENYLASKKKKAH